jgi:hypothetical protein
LTDIADHVFPPIHRLPITPGNEFSAVNYWRQPIPEIQELELDLKEPEPGTKKK